ncbi:hypothetical protein [Myroides odoratimimus]|uniref:hypothetical protein n=1 Tax=Myroides odoratimimus TaxID=76832 RepID=UPI00046A20BA|nr:hypothetical protein [Myroides odoratimimus]
MKKSVKVAMLLGVITLSMVSCDKDDNQLQMKKEVKVNGVDEQESIDWGDTPIKRPTANKQANYANEEQESIDWGDTPIKRPTANKQANYANEEQESIDWGDTPIKRPTTK